MPGDALTLADLPLIVEQVQQKLAAAGSGGGSSRVQFGTVRSVQYAEGRIPLASVLLDGSDANNPLQIPSVYSGLLFASLRVAVLWDPPHQCYIIGTAAIPEVPAGRLSLQCPTEG